MKKVYISIPITGRPMAEVRKEADSIAKQLSALGFEAINPLTIPNDTDSYAVCMGKDIAALLECHQICFAPGWSDSRGCCAERAVAKIYGIAQHELSAVR